MTISARKVGYALLMTRAVRQVSAGRAKAAHATLKKAAKLDTGNSGIADAMLAYCCIGIGDNKGAASACRRVLDSKVEDPTPDRKYVEEYCRYLEAALANDYVEYASRWNKLQIMPHSIELDDALPVDRLFTPGASSVLYY